MKVEWYKKNSPPPPRKLVNARWRDFDTAKTREEFLDVAAIQ